MGAGEHVFDETLVTRHVNDARRSPIRQIEMGEA